MIYRFYCFIIRYIFTIYNKPQEEEEEEEEKEDEEKAAAAMDHENMATGWDVS